MGPPPRSRRAGTRGHQVRTPCAAVVAFLFGVVNAVLMERSGSIWPAVIAHATNNTIAFVLAFLLG